MAFWVGEENTNPAKKTACEKNDRKGPCTASFDFPYELVQFKRRKLSPPRMPLALSTRMSHFWYHTDRHEQ